MSASRSSVAQLGAGREGAERDRDRADARGSQPPDDERRTVRVQQADVRAPSGARREQPLRQRRRSRRRVGVRQHVVVADQQRMVAAAATALAQERGHRQRQIRRRRRRRRHSRSRSVRRAGRHVRQAASVAGDRLHRRGAQRVVAAEQLGARRDAASVGRRGRSRTSAALPSGVGAGTRRATTSSCRPRRRRSCGAGRRSRRTWRARRRARRRAGPRTRAGTSRVPVACGPSTAISYSGKHGLYAPMSREWSTYGRPSAGASAPSRGTGIGGHPAPRARPRRRARSSTSCATAGSSCSSACTRPATRRSSGASSSDLGQRLDAERPRSCRVHQALHCRTARARRRGRPCPTACAGSSSTSRSSSGSS